MPLLPNIAAKLVVLHRPFWRSESGSAPEPTSRGSQDVFEASSATIQWPPQSEPYAQPSVASSPNRSKNMHSLHRSGSANSAHLAASMSYQVQQALFEKLKADITDALIKNIVSPIMINECDKLVANAPANVSALHP